MVGAVILTHSFIARELIASAEYIVGKMKGIVALSFDGQSNAFEARQFISKAIEQVDQGEGVIILTDLFGGSPSNLGFSFLDRDKIEVITGVNLPMILTFWTYREDRNLIELAKLIQLSGKRNISRVKVLLGTRGALERSTRKKAKENSQS